MLRELENPHLHEVPVEEVENSVEVREVENFHENLEIDQTERGVFLCGLHANLHL